MASPSVARGWQRPFHHLSLTFLLCVAPKQVPKLMELVGLGYSSWFVYRYLLFKENRKDLVADVEELKTKIGGDKM
jgi:hypothetical protein